jgi:hypothetical protein
MAAAPCSYKATEAAAEAPPAEAATTAQPAAAAGDSLFIFTIGLQYCTYRDIVAYICFQFSMEYTVLKKICSNKRSTEVSMQISQLSGFFNLSY